MRWLVWILIIVGTVGCAGTGAESGADCADPTAAAHEPLRVDGWLGDVLAARPDLDPDSCLVFAHALADDGASWLCLRLDLADGAVVRVDGPGAVEVRLRDGDRSWSVRDLGLHVPLHGDGNTYLNSERGPITIRDAHGLDDGGRGVCFLARLPRCDVGATEVESIETVAGVWLHKP